jgi:hypothetical protein
MTISTPKLIYKIEEVEEKDFEEIANLENTVFDDDPITVYAFGPTRNSPTNVAHRVKSLASKPKGCEVRMRKVVDPETKQIIGFSYWKFFLEPWNPHPLPEDKVAEPVSNGTEMGDAIDSGDSTAEASNKKNTESIWPEGSNVELCEQVFIGADLSREREFAGKSHVGMPPIITCLTRAAHVPLFPLW